MHSALEFSNLNKAFGPTQALRNVSLNLEPGEILGFLGPNGAGKSTALRVALGLLKADSGSVTVAGAPAGSDEARRSVAYVPGDVSLWPRLTGNETFELMASLHGGDDLARRQELIERFDLNPTKRIRALSKGNRQKVALIAAFASNAKVLLLDEPTSGLDPFMERVFRECASEARQRGVSILLSSHIMSEVEHLCDRVAMIRGGEIIAVSTIAELRSRTRVEIDVVGNIGSIADYRSLPGVEDAVLSSDGAHFTVVGSMSPLLKELAKKSIDSFKTREASLEEIFLSFYDHDH